LRRRNATGIVDGRVRHGGRRVHYPFCGATMRTCELPGGAAMPVLGLGTWRMGERAQNRGAEVAAIRSAIGIGYRLFDTAEMYGEGGAETVLGEALAAALRASEVRREDLFIVSKVYPHNASRKGTVAAFDRSRARLQLDHIDLYLLHWRGQHPLRDTCEALQALQADGRIGHWGVSNFDTDDLQELQAVQDDLGLSAGPLACAINQVYYSLSSRGPEFSLLPWQRAHSMPLMAYSPIDQGALLAEPALQALAAQRGATAAQVALAWVLTQDGLVAIPKAAHEAHLRENFSAASLVLTGDELALLQSAFPPPRRKAPLAVL
jgi:diketogulonate reductase-like aldo/keto reductase